MKANELRLGNLVNFSNHIQPDNYVKINARWFSSLAAGRALNEIKDDEEISGYYSGIPLTPEILEKAGFVKEGLQCDYTNGLIDLYNDNEGYRFGLNGYVTQLNYQYLHQIQNLYFALTSEELNINL